MALTDTELAQTRQLIAVEAALLSLAGNEATITSKLSATKVNLSSLTAATTPADADITLLRQGTQDKSVALSVLQTYVLGGGPYLPTASIPVYGATIGSSSGVKITMASAATTAAFSAAEVIVGTALGGVPYKVTNPSLTLTLTSTGAGGMYSAASPTSAWIGIYLIYNPTTAVSALFGVNTSLATITNICPVTLPTGYTASTLVGYGLTNSSGTFVYSRVIGRTFIYMGGGKSILNSTSGANTPTSISISTTVPPGALTVSGQVGAVSATTTQQYSSYIQSDSAGTAQQLIAGYPPVGGAVVGMYKAILLTAQTIYYYCTYATGATFAISANEFTF